MGRQLESAIVETFEGEALPAAVGVKHSDRVLESRKAHYAMPQVVLPMRVRSFGVHVCFYLASH